LIEDLRLLGRQSTFTESYEVICPQHGYLFSNMAHNYIVVTPLYLARVPANIAIARPPPNFSLSTV
jgi:hypothetical protein